MLWSWWLFPIATGLDMSWIYGLNLFHEMPDVSFVRDIVFTYGPLGYVLMGQPFSNHAFYSFLFYAVMMILGSTIMGYALFSPRLAKYNTRPGNVVLSFVLTILGCKFSSFDYVIEFMLIVLLFLSREAQRRIFFIGSVALLLLDTTLKFNLAVVGIATMGMYLFVRKYIDQAAVKQEVRILAMGIIGFFGLAYAVYGGAFVAFLKGVEQITSGYNVAMSFPIDASWAPFLGVGMAIMLLLPLVVRKTSHNVGTLCILLMPFLGAYKHGIVRADAHIRIFIVFSCLLLGQVLFWSDERVGDRNRYSNGICLSAVGMLLVLLLALPAGSWKFTDFGVAAEQASDAWRTDPATYQKYDSRTVFLSDEFREIMSDASYTVVPWELSVVQPGDHFIPLPVFQTYSAYTPYLDRLDAKAFTEKEIQYVYLSLDVIDNRFPLIETPAIWKTLFLHYAIVARDGKTFLLQRREKDYEETFLTARTVKSGEAVAIPDGGENGYIVASVHSALNVTGKIAKLLYKIPEVDMEVEFTDGTKVGKRVLLDNLSNDCLISVLPIDERDFSSIMAHSGDVQKVKQIRFRGDGLKYYQDTMDIQFKKITMAEPPQGDQGGGHDDL